MTSFVHDMQLRRRIEDHLKGFDRHGHDNPALKRAAVALVVAPAPGDGGASVLLTLRPTSIKRHSNQYALPGGRIDEGETAAEAALRETAEELGLDLHGDDILGRLDDFPTRSGYCIAPFVVWCPSEARLRPNPDEVAQVFHIPFDELNAPSIPRLKKTGKSEHPVMSAHIPTLGHQIYAPTAAILYQFREIALRGTPTRTAHFEQPTFAWR